MKKKQEKHHPKCEHSMHKKHESKKEKAHAKHEKKERAALEKLGKKEKKIEKVMHEFKYGELHSGSKKGPLVRNPKQAIAIAISESKRKKRRK